MYFLWNTFLINAGNFGQGFAFISAKWLIPSVMCRVQNDTMMSARAPALEQYLAFRSQPKSITVPPSVLETGAKSYFDQETLKSWESLVVRWYNIHKDQLHTRRSSPVAM